MRLGRQGRRSATGAPRPDARETQQNGRMRRSNARWQRWWEAADKPQNFHGRMGRAPNRTGESSEGRWSPNRGRAECTSSACSIAAAESWAKSNSLPAGMGEEWSLATSLTPAECLAPGSGIEGCEGRQRSEASAAQRLLYSAFLPGMHK